VRSIAVLAALAALAVVPLAAQTTPAPLAPGAVEGFDVASVKANRSGESRIGFGFPPGGLTATNLPLRALIIQAHRLHEYELLNLPEWARDERYDVTARTSHARASGDDRLRMLRTLLADRFKLRMHAETREMALYSLEFAREDRRLGPNLIPSTVDCVARSRGDQPAPPPAPPRPGEPPPPDCSVSLGMTPNESFLNAGGMAFPELVRLISRNLGRPIVDMTGLTGSYNVQMRFQADAPGLPGLPLPPRPVPLGASADSTAPSLMTAVQEQLGLRLESGRGPVPVQVVDNVERPAED
jgi:uncharacterized protein (TIGR03435 family)